MSSGGGQECARVRDHLIAFHTSESNPSYIVRIIYFFEHFNV